MLIRVSAFASLVILSSSASAQRTNCHWIGQTWTCDTAPPRTTLDPNAFGNAMKAVPQFPDYGQIMEQRARIQALQAQQAQLQAQQDAERLSQQREQQDYAAGQQRSALHPKVGQMVSGGDCAGAISAALQSGDIELASQIRTYCAK